MALSFTWIINVRQMSDNFCIANDVFDALHKIKLPKAVSIYVINFFNDVFSLMFNNVKTEKQLTIITIIGSMHFIRLR